MCFRRWKKTKQKNIMKHLIFFLRFKKSIDRSSIDRFSIHPEKKINEYCHNVNSVLKVNENSDIEPDDLCGELQIMVPDLSDSIQDTQQLLFYRTDNNLKEIYSSYAYDACKYSIF